MGQLQIRVISASKPLTYINALRVPRRMTSFIVRTTFSLVLTALFLSPCAAADYEYTTATARKAVLDHCKTECEEISEKPKLPYRATFERAMKGDAEALNTVFRNENYHSGDNESWAFAAWPLVHVVGDDKFASYLGELTDKQLSKVFEQVFYGGSDYPCAISGGYFARKFPRTSKIYKSRASAEIQKTINEAIKENCGKKSN